MPMRLRNLVWPRSGIRRTVAYIGHRVARLPGTSYAVAGGFAWGAAISFTPFIGLHLVLAGLGAWLSRCSILASAAGTVVGNPWTFPFIWAATYHIGAALLGTESSDLAPAATFEAAFETIWQSIGNWVLAVVGLPSTMPGPVDGRPFAELVRVVLLPMVLGALPLAAIAGVAFFVPLRRVIDGYQRVRRRRSLRQAKMAGMARGDVPNI